MANYTFDKLEQYLKQKGRDMEKGTARALFELSSDIVNRTPVDEGFAKNSWATSINKMETVGDVEADRRGAASINRARAEMKKFKLGDTVYQLSNLVYMPRLEYGYSKQRPKGMVRTAIDNFEKHLEEAIKNGK